MIDLSVVPKMPKELLFFMFYMHKGRDRAIPGGKRPDAKKLALLHSLPYVDQEMQPSEL